MKSLALVLFIFCFYSLNISAQQGKPLAKSSTSFSEGSMLSRTTFPGHALYESLKEVSFVKGDGAERNRVIEALKNYQRSIPGTNEDEIKDAFFVSALMLIPIHTELYRTPTKTFIRSFPIGYHQETLIDHAAKSAKMVISDRENINQGTINFHTDELKEIWQKYRIDEAQYGIQKTNETAVIAGYNCKKVIYTFGGTSRGPGVSTMVINMLPQKVTAWYTDDLDPSINHMHFIDFEMKKAVLKFEVEYDKKKKNKMMVEVIKVEPKKLDEGIFDLKSVLPIVEHVKGSFDAGVLYMTVVSNAISLLTK